MKKNCFPALITLAALGLSALAGTPAAHAYAPHKGLKQPQASESQEHLPPTAASSGDKQLRVDAAYLTPGSFQEAASANVRGGSTQSMESVVSAPSSQPPDEMNQLAQNLAGFHDLLEAHQVEHTQAANGDTTYTLAPGIRLTYLHGSESRQSTVQPQVGGGGDPWPYFEFDSNEQQALISGSAATLAGAICAIAGPESAGVGCAVGGGIVLTIVGIATAHGACPNNQIMRVYPLLGVAGVSCH
ncbi:hypothetical protein [Arthrobacter sp. RAF14]|uniref:hypothetical protein n=1 Tax=Arthrobacter sp. RAF14 TaxID=3233051 RepID=UPI003F8F7304